MVETQEVINIGLEKRGYLGQGLGSRKDIRSLLDYRNLFLCLSLPPQRCSRRYRPSGTPHLPNIGLLEIMPKAEVIESRTSKVLLLLESEKIHVSRY
jgi:hypothetical protein